MAPGGIAIPSKSLAIYFSSSSGGPKNKGPYSRLRFEAEVLREVAGGPIIAKHERHAWYVDGARYVRLDCDTRVLIHFEHLDGSTSPTYGPYDCVSCVDGVAYADRNVFAFVDLSIRDWYCHEDGRHWPLMVVDPA